MIAKLRRFVASLVVVSIAGLGLPPPSHAALLSTDAALASAERERVASMFDRADVQAQLQSYGVSAAQAKARVAALSDAEAAQLAAQIDALPVGGDGIIGALIFVFVILLITDILGLTKIFPFTRPVR